MDRVAAEARILAAMDAAAAAGEMRWGVDDCATWVGDIVAPLLGYDPVAEFRGRYRTKRGALRVMGRGGLMGAIQRVATERGWTWLPPARAAIGDIGISKDGPTIMICRAPGWFMGRSADGWAARAPRYIEQAWSPK